jgi:hypothetical protein
MRKKAKKAKTGQEKVSEAYDKLARSLREYILDLKPSEIYTFGSLHMAMFKQIYHNPHVKAKMLMTDEEFAEQDKLVLFGSFTQSAQQSTERPKPRLVVDNTKPSKPSLAKAKAKNKTNGH